MDTLLALVGVAAISGGVVASVAALRKPAVDLGAVLAELHVPDPGEVVLDEYRERLSEPLGARLVKPAGKRVARWVLAFLPGNYLEAQRRRLTTAGLSDRIRPEEYVALQIVVAAGGVLFGLLVATVSGWGPAGTLRSAIVWAALFSLGPPQWVGKAKQRRQTQVRKDLPDVLDLLVVAVEAGSGLEGAIQTVGGHFDTPLAVELNRMLREMELGVARRTALQNLRTRLDVPEVSSFILSLIQADALGMPIGKVLRVQAAEMRQKRRQWAREKAAKLPVKILFPLLLFIFPPLFVIVLGPAVISISENILK